MADSRPVALKFARARRLRRERTDAELALWHQLREQRLSGLRFRRQVPIGVFIADFCRRERHLVVELDGGQHGELTTAAKDRFRSRRIEERGYRVLRFWDHDVLTNIDGVLQAIVDAAGQSDSTAI